jgi:outer membrane lipoprotein carrier protein
LGLSPLHPIRLLGGRAGALTVLLVLATFQVTSLATPARASGAAVGTSTGAAAGASASTSTGAIEQLRGFVSDTRSASGAFTQQVVRTSGRPGETSSGNFAFTRPGKFRWAVQRPYEQLIVADGERLHFYDADLRQVTVRRMGDALAATPAALLFGTADLDASFVFSEMGERDGLAWLEAVPKSKESGFDRIQLGLRGGAPMAMEVRDAFNQVTRFTFRDVERNRPLDQNLFRFTPPPGVDVIR